MGRRGPTRIGTGLCRRTSVSMTKTTNQLAVAEMEQKNGAELIRITRRLFRQGKNSEQVKQWFVDAIPKALLVASMTNARRLKGYTATAQQATPTMNAQEC